MAPSLLDPGVMALLPAQGQWSDRDYLWLTDHMNRLAEYTGGIVEVLAMPTERHQAVLRYLFLAFLTLMQRTGGEVFFAPLRLRDRDQTESGSGAMRKPLPVTRYLDRLSECRADLTQRYGIASIGVFGSYIRNEQRAGSDLDVLLSFTTPPGLFKLVQLQDELTQLLDTSIDLVVRSELKPHIGARILAEVVEV